jgi:hypothetical protein
MEKTTVRVSQSHIDKGIKQDCEKCPVALAVLDAFPDAKWVSVDDDTIEVNYKNSFDSDEFDTPQAAAEFMMTFDAGIGGCEPFEFTIEPREDI